MPFLSDYAEMFLEWLCVYVRFIHGESFVSYTCFTFRVLMRDLKCELLMVEPEKNGRNSVDKVNNLE